MGLTSQMSGENHILSDIFNKLVHALTIRNNPPSEKKI